MLKVIYAIVLGYIIVKVYKFLKTIFKSVNTKREEEKVYGATQSKTKIDKKDIIDAQFEEIDDKENSPSNNN